MTRFLSRGGFLSKLGRFGLLLAVVAPFSLSSCTLKYEKMLMDKDLEIGDLRSQVAELSAERTELQDKNKRLGAELASAKRSATARPVQASLRSDLGKLQSRVGDGAKVRYRNGRISIGIENTVTFAAGSSTLKGSAGRTLQRVARVLLDEFSNKRIYIEGHTDSDPIRKSRKRYRSNRHLSSERADAVATYLVKRGVPETRIVVVGYGATDPEQRGSSNTAKARNRRVEIVVGERI